MKNIILGSTAGSRAGAGVTQFSEAIGALANAIGENFLGRNPRRKMAQICGDIENKPMAEGVLIIAPSLRVWDLIHHERKTFGKRRRRAPAKLWRRVVQIASVSTIEKTI